MSPDAIVPKVTRVRSARGYVGTCNGPVIEGTVFVRWDVGGGHCVAPEHLTEVTDE